MNWQQIYDVLSARSRLRRDGVAAALLIDQFGQGRLVVIR
jgi:hypothetical protein